MTIDEMIVINKKIRKYEGENSFLLSLQKQLKSGKYLDRVEVGKRKIKILSEKQYEVAIDIFDQEE